MFLTLRPSRRWVVNPWSLLLPIGGRHVEGIPRPGRSPVSHRCLNLLIGGCFGARRAPTLTDSQIPPSRSRPGRGRALPFSLAQKTGQRKYAPPRMFSRYSNFTDKTSICSKVCTPISALGPWGINLRIGAVDGTLISCCVPEGTLWGKGRKCTLLGRWPIRFHAP